MSCLDSSSPIVFFMPISINFFFPDFLFIINEGAVNHLSCPVSLLWNHSRLTFCWAKFFFSFSFFPPPPFFFNCWWKQNPRRESELQVHTVAQTSAWALHSQSCLLGHLSCLGSHFDLHRWRGQMFHTPDDVRRGMRRDPQEIPSAIIWL